MRALGYGLTLAAAVGLAACTKSASNPAPSGPSELGLSLQLQASPDVLTLDGQSQSTITVIARGPDGKPAANVGMRMEIRYYGSIVDLGRLSTKNITTGGNGQASVTYTAPTGAPANNSDDGASIVNITAIPSGTDYGNATERDVRIRLVPQGNVLPQAYAPVPKFFFSPQAPGEDQEVRFDASGSIASCLPDPSDPGNAAKCTPAGGAIVSYQWDFGNGRSGSGVRSDTHYEAAGTYTIRLTVVNDRGLSNSATGQISVTGLGGPTADFAFSPQSPGVGQTVNFDASASKAPADRSIIQYNWTFGDGGRGSGQFQSHRYDAANTYSVTLTVADSTGRTGTTTKQVTVGAGQGPVANFVVSPTVGSPAIEANFDGTLSTAPPGRSIVTYEWNFGDGDRGAGPRPSHRYPRAGSYAVVLTVTDSAGATNSVTKNYTVQ